MQRAISTLTLPVATGGYGTLTYTLTPELPDGLIFSATARTITGTPTAAADQTEYTYRVSDADDDEVSLSFKERNLGGLAPESR